MAIGFNLPNGAFRLNAQEAGGQPDYMAALQSGLKGSQMAAETVMKPQSLSEALLQAQLKNAHDRTINKYLPRSEEARIGSQEASGAATRSNTSMDDLRRQLLQQGVSKGEADRVLRQQMIDAFKTSGTSDLPSKDVDSTAQPTGESSIVDQGNPNLYKIDQMFSNPLMRKMLEGQGYKQTQTTHLDPKTGSVSVITTSPSGKVTVHTTKGSVANKGTPLTTKTISTLQLQKQAIPQLKKVIDDLIAAPSPFEPEGPFGVGKIYRANDRAKHQALVDLGRDIFVKAKGINATDTTLGTAKNVLDRRTGESDKSYHKRLLTFKDTLDNDEKDVDSALGGKSSTNKPKELTYNPATGRLE
jgi:hypothetical protein